MTKKPETTKRKPVNTRYDIAKGRLRGADICTEIRLPAPLFQHIALKAKRQRIGFSPMVRSILMAAVGKEIANDL